MALKNKQEELPMEVEIVEEVLDQEPTTEIVEAPSDLPDYAILNPEISMSAKIEVATNVANHLAPLVRNQGLVVKGLNRGNSEAEYVTVEGWEVLGTFLGIVPVTTTIAEITNDKKRIVGYRARATLYQNPIIENDEIVGGTVIARAEAQANKQGFQKDLFAIESMAQTRALGKAYRMGLGWVMKMAGFEGTFAEDMPTYRGGKQMRWRVHPSASKVAEDTHTGKSFLCYNEMTAEELVEYLNETYGDN